MMHQNKFVFVVCGDDAHIDTLNFSLPFLKHFSEFEIMVVTDTTRNNKCIQHSNIIDVKTPSHFDNHQASIYLKTGLHKFLDMSKKYCYLDTDVIAVSPTVDTIFEKKQGTISFAPDHCPINEFSPSSIYCGCLERKKEKSLALNILQESHNPNLKLTDAFTKTKLAEFAANLNASKKNTFTYAPKVIKFFLSRRHFHFNNAFYYDKKTKVWHTKEGHIVAYDVRGFYKKIEKESYFRWDKKKKIWLDDLNENAYVATCNHLIESIRDKFNIHVKDVNWQHWNGGVFLFDKESIPFLDTWHHLTLEIFKDSKWRTRDQGTLIATVWKMGLQNQKTLPQEFNYLADYHNKKIIFNKNGAFSKDKKKTFIRPALIHVYHEFGNKEWDVWQYIEGLKMPRNEQILQS